MQKAGKSGGKKRQMSEDNEIWGRMRGATGDEIEGAKSVCEMIASGRRDWMRGENRLDMALSSCCCGCAKEAGNWQVLDGEASAGQEARSGKKVSLNSRGRHGRL